MDALSTDQDLERKAREARKARVSFCMMTSLRPLRASRSLSVVVIVCGLLWSAVRAAGPEPLAQDKGAAGTWQRLLKLQTTASAMHTTAHPDDEHGGVIARLSSRLGARVSLTTLNRGESGDNAIGPELFDALGL